MENLEESEFDCVEFCTRSFRKEHELTYYIKCKYFTTHNIVIYKILCQKMVWINIFNPVQSLIETNYYTSL